MSSATTPAWTTDHRPSGRHQDKTSVNEDIITNSPLLFQMLKNLSVTEQHTLLDMGPASQSSIDFLSDYKCKIFISDSISELSKLDQKNTDNLQLWLKTLAKSIQFNQKDPPELDFIFLWSLPNYLAPHHLKALIEYLLPYTSAQTRLHTYIYNTQNMSAIPAKYHINRNQKVVMSSLSQNQINCPMYHLADLHNCFKPFKADHAVMLSSGVQEYLFSV